MGWKDALSYIKKAHSDEPVAEDAKLPIPARIGGLVLIQKTAFVRAQMDGSLITPPTEGESFVTGISKVAFDTTGLRIYRVYLDNSESEKFLQLVLKDGVIVEAVYCSNLYRMYPNAEEIDLFTGKGGVGLGADSYTVFKWQVENALSAAKLNDAFKDSEEIPYARECDGPEFVKPFHGVETRIDDSQGSKGLIQEFFYMPYVRQLENSVEYLFIATEIISSQNGDGSSRSREIHVDFTVGIPLDISRLVFQ